MTSSPRTSCPAARVSAAYARSNSSGVSSERSKRAQALPSGLRVLIARRKFAGSPRACSKRRKATKGLSVMTPPKSQSTARTAGFGIRALLLGLLVVIHRALEFLVFLARYRRAQFLQFGEMLLGLGQVGGQQVGLADVLVCVLVLGIELERLVVMIERLIELAGLAIGVAEEVVRIRIVGVGSNGFREQIDRLVPVLRFHGFFAFLEIWVVARDRVIVAQVGGRQLNERDQERRQQRSDRRFQTVFHSLLLPAR